MASSGFRALGRAASLISAVTCSGDGTFVSTFRAAGGVASSATLRSTQPHFLPCLSAAPMMR